MLTEHEIEFLRKLQTGDWQVSQSGPSPKAQSLIDRGYCQTLKYRSGPLGIYTGEVGIRVTEAGALVLAHLSK